MTLYKPYSIGAIFLLLLVGITLGYYWGGSHNDAKIAPLENHLYVVNEQNAQLQKSLTQAKRDLQIQIEAKKSLAQYLKSVQQNNSELSQNMHLYNTVSGNLEKTPLEMKAFQIYPTHDNKTFRYLAVLAKSTLKGLDTLEGNLTMVIKGHLNDQPLLLPVKYVNSSNDKGLPFKFQTITELSGELTLPEGFNAQEVVVSVNVENKGEVIEQAFPWLIS